MKKGVFSLVVVLMACMMAFGMSSISSADSENAGGPGGSMIFTYYDVRSAADGGLNLTDNYFTITNVSTHWAQSHVRVRTGDCSVELLDFDIFQSPNDNFTFDLYEAGGITFASCDTNTLEDSGFTLNFDADGDGTNDCFLLDSDTFPEMLSLITECGDCDTGASISTSEATELVKKGYVEVILEATLEPNPSDKFECENEDDSPGEAGYIDISDYTNMIDLWSDDDAGDGFCFSDLGHWPVLQGRQYFVEVDVTVSPVMVKRLAQLNANILSDWRDDGFILHENSYEDELAASGSGGDWTDCNDNDPGELCFAYAEAETTDGTGATADGANDMNRCFYTDMISGDPVINKFGAAATFGPTLADIEDDRNGDLGVTGPDILWYLCGDGLNYFNMADWIWSDGQYLKQFVDSHYFQAPQPGPYDMTTAFAFTFPCMHFIGEDAEITAVAIYDNAENKETIQIGKFISPGLPTAAIPAEEASLFSLSAPYNEGWIRFEVEASNDTAGCTDLSLPGTCNLAFRHADGSSNSETGYTPGYLGAVFTTGAENLGVSPFNYNNYYEVYP